MKTLRRLLGLTLVFIGATRPDAVLSASFDCAMAASSAEKVVCASEEVSRLDSDLETIFQMTLANSQNKQAMTAEQRTWLGATRDSCGDEACLATVYTQRIRALTSTLSPAQREVLSNVKAEEEAEAAWAAKEASEQAERQAEQARQDVEAATQQAAQQAAALQARNAAEQAAAEQVKKTAEIQAAEQATREQAQRHKDLLQHLSMAAALLLPVGLLLWLWTWSKKSPGRKQIAGTVSPLPTYPAFDAGAPGAQPAARFRWGLPLATGLAGAFVVAGFLLGGASWLATSSESQPVPTVAKRTPLSAQTQPSAPIAAAAGTARSIPAVSAPPESPAVQSVLPAAANMPFGGYAIALRGAFPGASIYRDESYARSQELVRNLLKGSDERQRRVVLDRVSVTDSGLPGIRLRSISFKFDSSTDRLTGIVSSVAYPEPGSAGIMELKRQIDARVGSMGVPQGDNGSYSVVHFEWRRMVAGTPVQLSLHSVPGGTVLAEHVGESYESLSLPALKDR